MDTEKQKIIEVSEISKKISQELQVILGVLSEHFEQSCGEKISISLLATPFYKENELMQYVTNSNKDDMIKCLGELLEEEKKGKDLGQAHKIESGYYPYNSEQKINTKHERDNAVNEAVENLSKELNKILGEEIVFSLSIVPTGKSKSFQGIRGVNVFSTIADESLIEFHLEMARYYRRKKQEKNNGTS
jgi:hypothetical protein